jgi:uncharacterized paraquat-inducible protein A
MLMACRCDFLVTIYAHTHAHSSHCPRCTVQMIIRAHECVMDGFERFAAGQLITVFSATNYCGTANNAGAILVLGRDLVR